MFVLYKLFVLYSQAVRPQVDAGHASLFVERTALRAHRITGACPTDAEWNANESHRNRQV